jgi:hypothetical protein
MKMFKIISAIVIGLVAAIYLSLPFVTEIHQYDRDTAVVSSLRTIHNAQARFKAIRGRFGTLKELADTGLIGPNFAAGKPISQFVYADAAVSSDSYCVCANRANDKAGKRDFNIVEDGEIRYHESETKGSAICGKGQSLTQEPDGK